MKKKKMQKESMLEAWESYLDPCPKCGAKTKIGTYKPKDASVGLQAVCTECDWKEVED